MSNHKSEDQQTQGILWEGEEGLSVPKDDARAAAAAAARARRDDGIPGKLRNILGSVGNGAGKWLVPAAAGVLILLVVTFALYVSQASRINALENEFAALRETTAAGGIEPLETEVDRLLGRVTSLEAELVAVDAAGEEIQALRSAITEQKADLMAMSERLEKLAQPSASAANTDAPEPEASPAPAPSGDGEWIVNLITVADPTEAERMQTRLKELGIESHFEEVERDGKTLHRLAVSGFASNGEAKAFGARIKDRLSLPDDPWITKQ